MGKKKPTLHEDVPEQVGGGGRKSKKKNLVIDDDEYSIGTELSEGSVVKEDTVAPAGGKKGKKKNLKGAHARDDKDDDDKNLDEKVEEDNMTEMVFSGKKKSKGTNSGRNVISKVSFDILVNEDEDDTQIHEDEPVTSFTGKKKSSKGPKKGGSKVSFALLDEQDEDNEQDENVEDEEDESTTMSFEGKKKSKGSKKSSSLFSTSTFDAIVDEMGDEANADHNVDDIDEVPVIAFSGKKKKLSKSAKKSSNLFSAVLLDEENEDSEDNAKPPPMDDPIAFEVDDTVIAFTGKKKSSKHKGTTLGDDVTVGFVSEVTDISTSNVETSELKPAQAGGVVVETSKSKKKKKKGARTVQEEEDLDKILAELGEAPPVSKPEPSSGSSAKDEKIEKASESVSVVDGNKESEEQGIAESAAAKKKKKKKEKEKEKKAALEVKKEEVKSKVADKKLPKHVREMQEALARRQEAEERQKREEEERLRKEEEERRKQEELERQAEEARLRKKVKEKEKQRLKKEADKLKEGQRRLEMIRNQLLSKTGNSMPAIDGSAPIKRHVYKTKTQKTCQGQTNGAITQALEEKTKEEETKIDAVGTVNVVEVAEKIQENGSFKKAEEDDEDWEAKSLEDTGLVLPVKGAFDDEETEPLSHSAAKKESIKAFQSVTDATPPAIAGVKPVTSKKVVPQPTCAQMSENEKKPSEAEAPGKNKGKKALTAESETGGDLRSPICCITGHVDTGKTKLLDCIRGTNVQEGEAGGITQQIGATYFPAANIRERTRADAKLNVPGLLVIDTPGHESFTNLRSRGSGLCDIAILVVDIMHGLKPQTIESLNLLKMRNTQFIVALNKVDRLYGWKTCRNSPIQIALKQQTREVQNEFNMRVVQVVTQFKEQGLNTELYYKKKKMGETFSIVPTSAISGEGIPDMLLLLVHLTQTTMIEKLIFSNVVQCTVLEVKVIEGHGATIDVVLVNGVVHEGDQIVVCGIQGPIVTTIRSLLTPHPMKELRVKGTYLHHKEIKAAQGIKITAQGLEHAIAGTELYVVGPDDDLEKITDLAKEDMDSVMSKIDKSGEGVYVQASTLGSLEALLELLKSPAVSIPVNAVSIGPIHKKDVMKAGVMLHKKIEYATILAFDVKVTPEAREYADEAGVKIFMDDTIYRLVNQFKAYIDNMKEEKKRAATDKVVFPCVLKIMPGCVFNKKDPIIVGVDVLQGIAKVGTPVCIPTQGFLDIGRIKTIKNNDQFIESATKGQKVAIKIVGTNPEEQQKDIWKTF